MEDLVASISMVYASLSLERDLSRMMVLSALEEEGEALLLLLPPSLVRPGPIAGLDTHTKSASCNTHSGPLLEPLPLPLVLITLMGLTPSMLNPALPVESALVRRLVTPPVPKRDTGEKALPLRLRAGSWLGEVLLSFKRESDAEDSKGSKAALERE